jgi:sialic acid synthase SpsE
VIVTAEICPAHDDSFDSALILIEAAAALAADAARF